MYGVVQSINTDASALAIDMIDSHFIAIFESGYIMAADWTPNRVV